MCVYICIILTDSIIFIFMFHLHCFDQFDYLKSLEIEEKINKIRWCQPANGALFLLSTNDKTIKYWKVGYYLYISRYYSMRRTLDLVVDQMLAIISEYLGSIFLEVTQCFLVALLSFLHHLHLSFVSEC